MKKIAKILVASVFVVVLCGTIAHAEKTTVEKITVIQIPYSNGNVSVVVDRGPTTCQVTLLAIVPGQDMYKRTYQLSTDAWVRDSNIGMNLHCLANGSVEIHY
jgi:hypothetical protein